MNPEYLYLWVATLSFLSLLQIFPFVLACYLALFRGNGVAGRWLFVPLAPLLGYGAFIAIVVVCLLPLMVANLFFVPAVKQLLNVVPGWVHAERLFAPATIVLIPLLCLILATASTIFLWPRWPLIFQALKRPRQSAEIRGQLPR